MPIGVGLGLLLSGLLGGGFSLFGGRQQANAARRAADVQDRFSREALDFEKARDARDYAQYLKELERGWGIENEDRGRRIQFENEREGRLNPFRAGGARGYTRLSDMLLRNPASLGRARSPRRLSDLYS